MNIGIDLDGVLFDSEKCYWVYAQLFDLLNNGKGIVHKNELRAQKRYDWTTEQIKEFENGCLKIQKHAHITPFAKGVLKALSKNNRIFIITSRGIMDSREIVLTKERLKEESIIFDKIIFKVKEKLEVCKNFKIDLMIDDFYDVVRCLAKNNIKCLYYCDISTKKLKHKNVVNVRNWGDIAIELAKREIINKNDIREILYERK